MENKEIQTNLEQDIQKQYPQKLKALYYKWGIYIVIGAILISALCLIIAFTFISRVDKHKINSTLPLQKIYSSLTFSPSTIFPIDSSIQKASLVLDVGENPTGIVTFTLNFDPKVIDSFDIRQELDPKSALSNSFKLTNVLVRTNEGYAMATLLLQPGAAEQFGQGKVATIFFSVKPTFVGTSSVSLENVLINSKAIKDKGKFSVQTNVLSITKSK